MRSRTAHWTAGILTTILCVIGYVFTHNIIPIISELMMGSMALLGVLLAVAHPRGGSIKRKLLLSRLILVLSGGGLLISGFALTTESLTLSLSIAAFGGVSLYAALFKIPWEAVEGGLEEYRSTGETVIVPDNTRYWCYYVYAGIFFLLISSLLHTLFPPKNPSDLVLLISTFLFSILLMFGSPLSGSIERTLLVYKALFAVAGLGFLIDGAYSFVVEGSLLSGLFALLGLFLLYHAFVRMSWTFMREVVEEYRSVEHPSTLGIERITERVQERRDEEANEPPS